MNKHDFHGEGKVLHGNGKKRARKVDSFAI